jgi:hypothetical protein
MNPDPYALISVVDPNPKDSLSFARIRIPNRIQKKSLGLDTDSSLDTCEIKNFVKNCRSNTEKRKKRIFAIGTLFPLAYMFQNTYETI